MALENSKPNRQNEPAEQIGPAAADDVLDQDALDMLLEVVGGERELLVELIDSFLEEAPPLLARMQAALENGDSDGLRLTSHTLKSSGFDFGATAFAHLCAELEELSRNGRLDGTPELVEQIVTEYERVRSALFAAKGEPVPTAAAGGTIISDPDASQDELPLAPEPVTDAALPETALIHELAALDNLGPEQAAFNAASQDQTMRSINIETAAQLIGRNPDLLLELLATVDDTAPQLSTAIQQWFNALLEWNRSRPTLGLTKK